MVFFFLLPMGYVGGETPQELRAWRKKEDGDVEKRADGIESQ